MNTAATGMTNHYECSCPHCHTQFPVDIGKKVICPQCNKAFFVDFDLVTIYVVNNRFQVCVSKEP